MDHALTPLRQLELVQRGQAVGVPVLGDGPQLRHRRQRDVGVSEVNYRGRTMGAPGTFGGLPTEADEAKPGFEDPAITECHNSTSMDTPSSPA